MIPQFLDAAGIVQVVWIDDYFAPLSRDVAVRRLKTHLLVAKGLGTSIAATPHFGDLDLSRAYRQLEDDIDERLLPLTEDEIRADEQALGRLVDAKPEPSPQPDLSPEEFDGLRAAFGDRLKLYWGQKWTEQGYGEYAPTDATTLFIIDKSFEREGGAYDGLKFLKDLVQRKNSYCVVLTHESTPASQNEDRGRFAQAIGIRPHLFSVLGKNQDKSLTVDQRFGRAIFEVFARYLTSQLAEVLAGAVAKATMDAVEEIGGESVYDTDHAIFENSIEEGASEADVLLRIFRSRQKPEIFAAVQAEDAQKIVQQIRDFRKKTEALRDRLGSPKVDLKAFRRWRQDEVFDDGVALNRLHSPLVCGDLFDVQLKSGDVKHYILLAQPCAISVRGKNGKRSGEVGLLVPITEVVPGVKKKPPEPAGGPASGAPATGKAATVIQEESGDDGIDESPYKYFDVKGVLDADRIWRVDFRKTMYVPLKILDLAVFNADGRVQLFRAHPNPKVTLLPGWQFRLDKARGWFPKAKEGIPPENYPRPAKPVSPLGSGAESVDPKIDGSSIRYPVQRVGRVETNLSDAIYAAWATYQTRAAFDHDFAKLEVDEAESDPATVALPADAIIQPAEAVACIEASAQSAPAGQTAPPRAAIPPVSENV